MWKYFTRNNTLSYLSVLPQLMQSYNNTWHRSIKRKPASVNKTNEKEVWDTLYSNNEQKTVKFKFSVGEQVRISKTKRMFKKGYLPNWTEEIFTVSKRISSRPPLYKLKDFDEEELEGTFYKKSSRKRTTSSEWKKYSKQERERARLNIWSSGMVGHPNSIVGSGIWQNYKRDDSVRRVTV
ncbi:uncharacterized protein [Ptychodera flava]|uniref:uncharacterized protein n=1 Tax=Ptychodera flava TaxID=63121 RepID=UPI00396A5EEC